MAGKKLLTMQEACRYLGISRTTLLKTEEEGLVTSTRTVGGHRRYARETLDQYLRATTGLGAPALRARHDVDEQVVLPRVVERLARSADSAESIMKEVLQDLVQILQSDAGLIALLDGQGRLNSRVTFGLGIPGAVQPALIPSDSTISGRVLELQRPLVYEDSEGDIPIEGLTQGVCAPLVYQGVPLGVIHILSFSRHQFLPTEVQFLSLIALYLASRLVNAQVVANSRRREDEMAGLNRLSQVIQEQRDLNSMAEVLLNEALQITKADAGIVYLYGPAGKIRVAAIRGDSADAQVHLMDHAESVISQVLDSDEPYFMFPSLPHSLAAAPASVNEMSSAVLFPLRSHEEKLGALLLCACSPREASQWQTGFLALACAQAALVVQREALCQHLAQMSENERSLRRYYEKMVEMAPMAMAIVDKDRRIIAWNRAVEELTGIPREEALGADQFRLQPSLLKQNGPEVMAKVIETRQIHRDSAFPYECRDGTVRYSDLTFLPFANDDGEVTAVIIFAQDVTELKTLRQ